MSKLLHTKDGRKIGNAILVRTQQLAPFGTVYHIETDFGNRFCFTLKELEDQFYIGEARNYDDWRSDRQATIFPDDGK